MKNYIKYFLCSIVFCFPYFVFGKITCNIEDYNALIDLDKDSISMNETANIKISSTFNYEVEYNIENNNIISISNDGIITPTANGSTKVNVIIKFLEENIKANECTSVLNINVLSSDSTLKLLTLEELDISPVFSKNDFDYEIKLPYSYEKVNIIAEATDSTATVTGDGRRYLNEGTNEFEIIVKASDGTTSTYKITILREEANDDNTLKSLIVEGYEISPKFKKDIYEYTLDVPKEVEDINISALATYDLAKILGTGKYSLATGENNFYITVIAENNTEQKYTLKINRSKGNGKLNKLEIDGYKLDKDFNNEIYTYNIIVNNNIDKLNIHAESDNGQVEIIGNEKLVVGENNIIIRVSGKDIGSSTYKIIVNKLSVEEQNRQEKNDLLLKILLIIFVISIIVMFTVIAIFLKRNYVKGKKKKIKINKKNKKKE